MSFFTALEARARQVDSLLCIGLDPHLPDLAAPTPQAARDFCLRLIDACADTAAAFKPNAAFFEVFGAEGWLALKDVIAAIPPETPVILDAKRGDIASTAQAYAQAVFETLGAGAVTLSPYLGSDSIAPFLQDSQRAVFLLCKTSNPGAGDFQDLHLAAGQAGLGGQALYEAVAARAQAWARSGDLGPGGIGLVAGATYPEALARIRRQAPDLWLLAPGVGAQGGDLEAALQAGLRPDGLGLLLPTSRAVARSTDPRRAAEDLRSAISRGRARYTPAAQSAPAAPAWAALADGLLEAGCVRFGNFTLKSGLQSPIYLDLRRLVGFPRLLEAAAGAYAGLLGRLAFDRLAALPYAALPIGAAVSLAGGWPLIYPRKEVKQYGTKAEIEGVYAPGERAAVLDDLATTGGSKFEAIEKLAAAGLAVQDVVVLIDRQSGAREALAERGYNLHSVFTLSELLDYWQAVGSISGDQAEQTRRFMRESAAG